MDWEFASNGTVLNSGGEDEEIKEEADAVRHASDPQFSISIEQHVLLPDVNREGDSVNKALVVHAEVQEHHRRRRRVATGVRPVLHVAFWARSGPKEAREGI
uniref:Uncharacterized protein n=1 Tax=Leersia perrieri TaxID=77586 RepID=A0A0D9XRF8_9ORYZ